MLCVNDKGDLGAKIADLGTAVQLTSAQGKVTDPTGTTGYAGKNCVRMLCSISTVYWSLSVIENLFCCWHV